MERYSYANHARRRNYRACTSDCDTDKAITELTVTCKNLDGQFAAMQNKNTESHRRIWEHNDEQDKMLNNHEARIKSIERGERRNTYESE